MNNLLNALGLDRATQEKLPPNIIQGATIIEGLQGIYSNAPESPKKDILASTIAESVRLLMKEINTFINAGMPEQEPEQDEHKETTPPQEDDNEPTNPNKWRLPTKEEFENVLYPNKDLIPNLKIDDYYWSSSENDNYGVWGFNFKLGIADEGSKTSVLRVRAVREVSSNSTDSENWVVIGNLEVWNEDLGDMDVNEEMDWYEAVAEVEKLNNTQETEPTPPQEDDNEPTNSNKWRLPTKEEFNNVLYPNIDLIPNLKIDYYWSSSHNGYDTAWIFYFETGKSYYYNKNYAGQVRAVREVSSNSTDSENWVVIGNLEVWNEDLGTMNWNDAVAEVEKLNNTQETEPTPSQEKAKVKFIKISWTGEEFDTWAKFQNYLEDVYQDWKRDGTEGGYEKIKFEVEWENGKKMVDRVDVGNNQGDFNPYKEFIGSYLEKQNQAMYDSNFEGNERREIVSWKDSEGQEQETEQDEHREPTPPQEDDNEPTNPNKWRLPTLTDLVRVLNPNKDLIPNFNKEEDYWSNSQPNDTRRAWYYDFKDDATFSELTKELKGVRAVRDFPSDSTDSENWTIIGNLEVWNEDLGEMNWDDAVAEVEKLNNTQETEPTPPTPPTPPKPKGKKPKPPTPPKPPKKRKPEEEHIPQDDYENMDEEELATMLSELEDLLVVLDENDSEYQEVKNEITKIKQYIN